MHGRNGTVNELVFLGVFFNPDDSARTSSHLPVKVLLVFPKESFVKSSLSVYNFPFGAHICFKSAAAHWKMTTITKIITVECRLCCRLQIESDTRFPMMNWMKVRWFYFVMRRRQQEFLSSSYLIINLAQGDGKKQMINNALMSKGGLYCLKRSMHTINFTCAG